MICRYCNAVYSPANRECLSCGAPKGAIVQTVLDGSKASVVSILEFQMIAVGVIIVTAVTLTAHVWFDGVRWLEPVSIYWALYIVPGLLCAAAIISLREGVLRAGINLMLSMVIWFAIGLVSLIVLQTL